MALFNQKRKEAASAGKVWKYLTYALGEIVIVICGILIALQVNNYNDARKARNQVASLMEALQQEVRNNLAGNRRLCDWGLMKDTLCQRVLTDQIALEDYHSNPGLEGLITNYYPYFAKQEQVTKGLNSADAWPEEYAPLADQLRTYVSRIMLTTETGESVKESTLSTIAWLGENFTWYSRTDPESMRRKYRFMHTDSLYRNRVSHYHLLGVRNFVQQAELTATFEGQLLAEFAQRVDGASIQEVEDILRTDGWVSLPSVPCDSLPTPAWQTGYALGGLILNTNTDTMQVFLPGLPVPPATIDPESVGVLRAPANQVIGVRTSKGDCYGRYTMARNGLVVLH